MVQLINGLDFVFLCVAVCLCTIENQSLKQRKKAFEPRKKLHQNIYLRPFYRTLKAAIIVYNQLRFFFFEDDEIISWLPSVKASHKASRFSYFQLFALCRASLEALAEEAVSALS